MDEGERNRLCSLTGQLALEMQEAVQLAKSSFTTNPHQWIEKQVGVQLGPFIGKFADYYTALGVQSHAQLDSVFKANFKSVQG